MKLTKKISALGLAVVMMASMGSLGASANSWNVHYTPGAPTSDTVTLCTNTFSSTSSISYIYENCGAFSTSQSSSGQIGHVEYWGYSANNSGQSVGLRFNDYSHYNKQNTHVIYFNGVNPSYYLLIVKHKLITNGVTCSASGDVYL